MMFTVGYFVFVKLEDKVIDITPDKKGLTHMEARYLARKFVSSNAGYRAYVMAPIEVSGSELQPNIRPNEHFGPTSN